MSTAAEYGGVWTALASAQLHGRACIVCGTADGRLDPAGHAYTVTRAGRLGWAVVMCTRHRAARR